MTAGRYCDKPIRLGDLYGNRFEIALRDVDADPDQLAKVSYCSRACLSISP